MKDMIALREQLIIERDGWWAVQAAFMNQQQSGWLADEFNDVSHHINHVSKRLEIVELAIRLAEKEHTDGK